MSSSNAGNGARPVLRKVRGQVTSDGAGVRLTRILGTRELPDLDPFLLLDEFRSDSPDDYIGGFPDHPHRGFETVTYMLAGRMRHHDSQGNSGLLVPGSVQWMTAGRGIVHSEMPEQENGLLWGFQLWVNLPAAQKMTAPRYQDIAPERIPEVERPGVRVRVLAGRLDGVEGPVQAVATEPVYWDVHLEPGARFEAELPAGHQAFAYVYQGNARIGDTELVRGELGVLGGGNRFVATAGEEPARLIMVAGRPLREPVARYGPFVMNTREQILQAFEDFNAGRF
ncbi:MAG: pirin family protein [Pseudomonadota bacterium]|jgi:Pirin-related protein|nr:MAG: quercetin 2,3-dioxygenase [Pseudomonadota bacterium]